MLWAICVHVYPAVGNNPALRFRDSTSNWVIRPRILFLSSLNHPNFVSTSHDWAKPFVYASDNYKVIMLIVFEMGSIVWEENSWQMRINLGSSWQERVHLVKGETRKGSVPIEVLKGNKKTYHSKESLQKLLDLGLLWFLSSCVSWQHALRQRSHSVSTEMHCTGMRDVTSSEVRIQKNWTLRVQRVIRNAEDISRLKPV